MSKEAPIYPASDPASVRQVAALLRNGGVAVIPTDTVYGLAASVFDDDAVARVFRVKGRASDVAVPVLLQTAADLPLLVADVSSIAWKLIDRFWPGALTLVFPARPSVSRALTGGGRTVAVRVPAARSCLQLLESVGIPLVGTSANRSGDPAATTAMEASVAIGGEVDAILEDDASVSGPIPSTVVELVDGNPVVHREGAISADAIRRVVGSRVSVSTALTRRPRER
jgi:L-threonylcarbamoyladenylate synthase